MPPSPHYTSYHQQQLQQQQQQQHPTYHSSHHQQHQAYVVGAGGSSELKGSQPAPFSFPQVSAFPSQPCILKGLSQQIDFAFDDVYC
jgi:hypothetical protein